MPEVETAPSDLDSVEEPARIRRWIWWLGLGATLIVSAALSLKAYAEGLPVIFNRIAFLDKALHFALAGALAFFLDGALRRRVLRIAGISLPLAAMLILAPLAVEEFLQRFSVNRSSSVSDYAADVAGVVVLIWLSRRVDR